MKNTKLKKNWKEEDKTERKNKENSEKENKDFAIIEILNYGRCYGL